MRALTDILLFFLLAVIVWQDMKQRAISWYLLPALLCCFIMKAVGSNEEWVLPFSFQNLAFVLIQLFILTVYISIKNKRFCNIINTWLGIGDILFFIVICAAFSPVNFIFFYISSLVITLMVVIVYRSVVKKFNPEIPLAGGMAACLLLLLSGSYFFPGFDFYSDQFLLTMMDL